jgi:putative DNA primase/helicase
MRVVISIGGSVLAPELDSDRVAAHAEAIESLAGEGCELGIVVGGGGSNGKSMFLDLIESFIGGYNVVHRELQDFGEDMYALNNLQGKLANLATEIGEQELDDTTAFKKATGRDTIDAAVKYEKPITFENYATLMFATNEMPVFGQDNHAIWRRWVYVDFPYTFDADDPDAKDPEPERVIERRIKGEEQFEALLLRCQQEIQRWYEGEPLFADAMEADEVRDKMKKAAEPVYAFATTCLEPTEDDDDFVQQSVVRACYRAFADEEDLPRIADNEFGKRLHAQRDLSLESGQKRINGTMTSVYKRVELSGRGRQVLGVDTADDDGQGQVDDEYDQPAPIVMERLEEMFEENDRDPVPVEGVVWGLTDKMGKTTAEQTLDQLITNGDVIELGDGVAPK